MYVDKLKLINYRNYDDLEIIFNKNINIFYGNNAQGKTNILEALYFISCAKSHRTNKDKELIKWEKEDSYISALIKKANSEIKIDSKISKNDKKSIKINGSSINKIGELFGNLNCVMFSPENISLIKMGPSEKRRFLDIGISQIKPSYFYNLQQYYRVILQRNSLLKELKKSRKQIDMLSIWNQNIIEIGSKIMYHRNEYLKKILMFAKDIHNSIAKESIDIIYNPSIKIDELKEISNIKNMLKTALENTVENDINYGLTSVGPHRDNFEVNINNINSRIFASQGQQRTIVLSLKLSELELYKEEVGEYPILLLDDVMSELDDNRQQFLLNYLKNIQTFITCTNKDKFLIENTSFYNVFDGTVDKQY